MNARASVVVGAMVAIGCGGAPKPADTPSLAADGGAASATMATGASTPDGGSTPTGASTSTSSSGTPAAASPAPDAAPAAPAHPFAHTAEEATSLMDDAINAKASDVMTCVDAARTRRKDAHAKIVLEIGIDQQGHLIAVKLPKGEKADKVLADCMMGVLRSAPFPESHAGVITIRKTFEDKAVYK